MKEDLAAARDLQELMHSILPVLSGPRSYAFGLTMYERLVEVAERVYPEGLPDRGTPLSEVNAVLEGLWARLPDGPADPSWAVRSFRWLSDDPQPGAVPAALSHHPLKFGMVTIRWRAAAAAEALTMWQTMTSAVPTGLYPLEFAAEREALLVLRDSPELDLPPLRARAREVGRELARLGMA